MIMIIVFRSTPYSFSFPAIEFRREHWTSDHIFIELCVYCWNWRNKHKSIFNRKNVNFSEVPQIKSLTKSEFIH